MTIAINNHPHYHLLIQEQNMCSSSYQGIQILSQYIEINIDSIDNIRFQIRQYLRRHIYIRLSLLRILAFVDVIYQFFRVLDPCRVKWNIGILIGAYKSYVFKPL